MSAPRILWNPMDIRIRNSIVAAVDKVCLDHAPKLSRIEVRVFALEEEDQIVIEVCGWHNKELVGVLRDQLPINEQPGQRATVGELQESAVVEGGSGAPVGRSGCSFPWTSAPGVTIQLLQEPMTFVSVKPPVGWQCPVCGRGGAPGMPECPCHLQKKE